MYRLQCKCSNQYDGELDQRFYKNICHRSDFVCRPDLPHSWNVILLDPTEVALYRLTMTSIKNSTTWFKKRESLGKYSV